MKSTVKCPKCKGKGSIPLRRTLQIVLDHIQKHPGDSAADMWRASKEKIGATAFNRRLDALLALGLVRRKEKDSKAWGWWAV